MKEFLLKHMFLKYAFLTNNNKEILFMIMLWLCIYMKPEQAKDLIIRTIMATVIGLGMQKLIEKFFPPNLK